MNQIEDSRNLNIERSEILERSFELSEESIEIQKIFRIWKFQIANWNS